MKLITITPMSGDRCDMRRYDSAHSRPSGQIKSSAVTNPLVSSLILRTCTADGARLPLRYRLIEAGVTPIALAKAACDMLCSERKSDSFIPPRYHDGNGCQATITSLVILDSNGTGYSGSMRTELDRFLINIWKSKKISAAKIARRIGVSSKQVTVWRKGEQPIPDERAIALAAELGVTPFDIKADFNKPIFDGIPDLDEREELRLHMKRVFRNKVSVLPTPIQAPPNHAPQTDTIPTKKVSRNNRTK